MVTAKTVFELPASDTDSVSIDANQLTNAVSRIDDSALVTRTPEGGAPSDSPA